MGFIEERDNQIEEAVKDIIYTFMSDDHLQFESVYSAIRSRLKKLLDWEVDV